MRFKLLDIMAKNKIDCLWAVLVQLLIFNKDNNRLFIYLSKAKPAKTTKLMFETLWPQYTSRNAEYSKTQQ